jgi:hypothetical protein
MHLLVSLIVPPQQVLAIYDAPFADHHLNRSRIPDIIQRIRPEDQEIGAFAGLESTEVVREAQQLGSPPSGRGCGCSDKDRQQHAGVSVL